MFDRSSSLSASNPNAQASNPNAQDGGPVFTRPFDRQHLTWGAVKEQNEEDIGKTKNHTGTLVGEDIYIFGGYDGLKNHNKLHVYNITSSEWSQPQPFGTLPTGRNGHSATLLYSRGVAAGAPSIATPGAPSAGDFMSKSAGAAFGASAVPPVARGRGGFPGDHGGTGNHGHVVGTDLMSGPGARLAERNPDPGPTFAPLRSATAPFSSRPTRGGGPLLSPASNGLTPAAILILGGWLGNGPLAAGDVHLLDLPRFEWVQPEFKGNPPGPCNMHTADLVTEDLVLVFRGGDGRAYLNDLHALDLANRSWHSFPTTGELPPPRANHSSCVVGGTVGGGGAALAGTPGAGAINSSFASDSHLFVFGGWDGTKRLNDLYVLNVHSRVWSYVRTSGQPPMARAGMSLSNVSGLLYLFGGSGHTTKCFNDCHIFDPRISTWLEAAPTDSKLYYTKRKAQQTLRLSPGETCVPDRRAGHACVPVGRRLFIFGGACGNTYFSKSDTFILDTDAAPDVNLEMAPLVSHAVRHQLSAYFDNEQFSDVTFVFPATGQRLFAHRVLLSVFSDHFRSMFSNSWREAVENEITLPEDIAYDVFRAILYFIYTGGGDEQILRCPNSYPFSSSAATYSQDHDQEGVARSQQDEERDSEMQVNYLLQLLRAADEFCIDHIKSKCEEKLCVAVSASTVHLVHAEAEKYCAPVLRRYCQWLIRQEEHRGAAAAAEGVIGVVELDYRDDQAAPVAGQEQDPEAVEQPGIRVPDNHQRFSLGSVSMSNNVNLQHHPRQLINRSTPPGGPLLGAAGAPPPSEMRTSPKNAANPNRKAATAARAGAEPLFRPTDRNAGNNVQGVEDAHIAGGRSTEDGGVIVDGTAGAVRVTAGETQAAEGPPPPGSQHQQHTSSRNTNRNS